MPKKIALRSITLVRGKGDSAKRITVAPNESFDFNDAELKEFAEAEENHNKSQEHLPVAAREPFMPFVRDPINESGENEPQTITDLSRSSKPAGKGQGGDGKGQGGDGDKGQGGDGKKDGDL